MRTVSLTATFISSILLFVGGTPAITAKKHHKHHKKHNICHTRACVVRVKRKWAKAHPRARASGPHYTVNSTCYHEGSITSSGAAPYVGEVANNFLPLGTRIRLDHAVFGLREFVILDHIGYGSELDIYGPSESACLQYGRQTLGFSVMR